LKNTNKTDEAHPGYKLYQRVSEIMALKNTKPLKIILTIILLTLICAFATLYLFSNNTPHVIIISLDTTRVDHLGCYGNNWIQTPHIDKLAEKSILFENCLTAAPSTLTAHASLFTGKYFYRPDDTF